VELANTSREPRKAVNSSPARAVESLVSVLTKRSPAEPKRSDRPWNGRGGEIVYHRVVRVVLIVLILFGAGVARADHDARARAARAKLSAQLALLAENKLDAFAAMFPDNTDSAVMFPSTRRAAIGRTAIRAAAKDWAGAGRAATAVTIVGTPTVGQKLDRDPSKRASHLVVVSSEIDVTVKGSSRPILMRVTSVFSDGLETGNPKVLVSVAMFVSLPTEPKDLRGEDKLVESGAIDRFLDLLRVPDLLAARFDAGPGDVVIGPSKAEHAHGDDAKKLLATWHEHKLTIIGKPHVARNLDWTYVMATVALKRDGDLPAPINVLLVGYPECKGACTGTDMTPHVVTLHFGQSR
jgi:hypothetical protein